MKLYLSILLAAVLLYSCGHAGKKTKSNANELSYLPADTTAGPLSAAINITGNIPVKELTAQVKLSNSGPAAIDIQEIVVSTADGLRSIPKTGVEHIILANGKDTTLLLKFRPLNDLKLYQITGLQGNFKPAYNTQITYKIAGTDSLTMLQVKSASEKGEYLAYSTKNKSHITGYSFNTKTGFNEKETKYLLTLKQITQTPFVYLSEQEIAIAGLNFRLRSYSRQDTIHAELLVVNHAEFPVKIMKDAFDINTDDKPSPATSKSITLQKISGAQQHPGMMEKGDRVVILFKKYLKTTTSGNEKLTISFHDAFMLSGPIPLFQHDIQLVAAQF